MVIRINGHSDNPPCFLRNRSPSDGWILLVKGGGRNVFPIDYPGCP